MDRKGTIRTIVGRSGRGCRLTMLALAVAWLVQGCAQSEPPASTAPSPPSAAAPAPAPGPATSRWDGVYRGVDQLVGGSPAQCVAGGTTSIVLTVHGSDVRFELSSEGQSAPVVARGLGVLLADGTIRSFTIRQAVGKGYNAIEIAGKFTDSAFEGESNSSQSGCRRRLVLSRS